MMSSSVVTQIKTEQSSLTGNSSSKQHESHPITREPRRISTNETSSTTSIYSAESYLQKRGSMRRGFGGNYRRVSDSFSIENRRPSSVYEARSSSSSIGNISQTSSSSIVDRNSNEIDSSAEVSSLSKRNEEKQHLLKSILLSDSLRDTKLVVYTEKKKSEEDCIPLLSGQTAEKPVLIRQGKSDNGSNRVGAERRIASAGNGVRLAPNTEEEKEEEEDRGSLSLSVMECIRTFEKIEAQPTSCSLSENRRSTITKTKVAELRASILRASTENLFSSAENLSKSFPDNGCLNNSSQIDDRSSAVGGHDLYDHHVNGKHKACARLNKTDGEVGKKWNRESREPFFVRRQSLNVEMFKDFNIAKTDAFIHLELRIPETVDDKRSHDECDRETTFNSVTNVAATCLTKTDSSDSGIDTKTDSSFVVHKGTPPEAAESRTSLDSHEFVQSPTSSTDGSGDLFLEHDDVRDSAEVTTEHVFRSMRADECHLSVVVLDLESDEFGRRSAGEVECERLTIELLRCLEGKEGMHEHFCHVLAAPGLFKTSFSYMTDLIKDVEIPESFTNSLASNSILEFVINNESYEKEKFEQVELLKCMRTKLALLKDTKCRIEVQNVQRKKFESEISALVKRKIVKKHFEKYQSYLDELDKVFYLLFQLTSRLALTENVLSRTMADMDDNNALKKSLVVKSNSLHQKIDDAVQLKEDIDQRSRLIDAILKQNLFQSEYGDYRKLVAMIVRSHYVRQWTCDRITLAEEQLKMLEKMTCSEENDFVES